MSVCALLLVVNACKTNSIKTADNSQNSLDWQGTYYGSLPCADCPGIETVVTLNANGTYRMTSHYKEANEGDLSYAGQFQWTKDGSSVILNNADGNGNSRTLKVGENKLFWLDATGKAVTGDLAGNYTLQKVNSAIVEKYWKLVELFGEPVRQEGGMTNAFMTLHAIGNRVNGNLGCNSFFGAYELNENQIKFSQVGSTMMMCSNMEAENKMKQVLERADSYIVQGDTLVLNRARMAPLARFVAVYM